MAITISGSGIVEANLADNAVTLAKMASGTDGEILTYDASGNPVSVSVGTDGQVLTSTGVGSPPAFEAAAAGGKLLQVVSATTGAKFSVTGKTFTTVTGLSPSITPISTSSKILITLNLNLSASVRYCGVKIYRDSTQIGMGDVDGSRSRISMQSMRNQNATNDQYVMHNASTAYLDSPSTTSAITYTVRIASVDDTGAVTHINRSDFDANDSYNSVGISTITLMEIQG